MEAFEVQAKATIASALIVSRAVEVPRIPTYPGSERDPAATRLKDLTEYVYRIITGANP